MTPGPRPPATSFMFISGYGGRYSETVRRHVSRHSVKGGRRQQGKGKSTLTQNPRGEFSESGRGRDGVTYPAPTSTQTLQLLRTDMHPVLRSFSDGLGNLRFDGGTTQHFLYSQTIQGEGQIDPFSSFPYPRSTRQDQLVEHCKFDFSSSARK